MTSTAEKFQQELKSIAVEFIGNKDAYGIYIGGQTGCGKTHICTAIAASGLNETLQSLRLAQENFRAVMEETEKYKNLDVTDGILRLLSNQIFQAINQIPEEQVQNIDFETLMKNAVALTRAVAYKKKIDIDSKDVLENGAEQFQGYIFEAMSEERPELYKEIKKFIKEKQS